MNILIIFSRYETLLESPVITLATSSADEALLSRLRGALGRNDAAERLAWGCHSCALKETSSLTPLVYSSFIASLVF